jgi:hypothetical protein
MARKPYPSDVTDEEWDFVAPYLTLMSEEPRQEHEWSVIVLSGRPRCDRVKHSGVQCQLAGLALVIQPAPFLVFSLHHQPIKHPIENVIEPLTFSVRPSRTKALALVILDGEDELAIWTVRRVPMPGVLRGFPIGDRRRSFSRSYSWVAPSLSSSASRRS